LFLKKHFVVMSWATRTRHASLIHRFLCFTTKVLLVFRRFDPSTTCEALTSIQQKLLTTASIMTRPAYCFYLR